MPRSLDDLIARADKLADQFERYGPEELDRGEPSGEAARQRYADVVGAWTT